MPYKKRPVLPALTNGQIELLRAKIRQRSIVRANGCRDWIGSRSSQMKYATIADPRRPSQPLYLHHATAEMNGKPKPANACPDGSHRWELHHVCKNRVCLNSDHMVWVTSRQHVALHVQDRAELVAQRKTRREAAKRTAQLLLSARNQPRPVRSVPAPAAGPAVATEMEMGAA
jgi:hypothetical protein